MPIRPLPEIFPEEYEDIECNCNIAPEFRILQNDLDAWPTPCRLQSSEDDSSFEQEATKYACALLDAPEASYKIPTADEKFRHKKAPAWWDCVQLAQSYNHSLNTLVTVDNHHDDCDGKGFETSAAPSMVFDDESDDEHDDGLRTPPPVACIMSPARASTLPSGLGLQLGVTPSPSPTREPKSSPNRETLLEPLPFLGLPIPFTNSHSRVTNVSRTDGSRAWLTRKVTFRAGGPSWRSSRNVQEAASTFAS